MEIGIWIIGWMIKFIGDCRVIMSNYPSQLADKFYKILHKFIKLITRKIILKRNTSLSNSAYHEHYTYAIVVILPVHNPEQHNLASLGRAFSVFLNTISLDQKVKLREPFTAFTPKNRKLIPQHSLTLR